MKLFVNMLLEWQNDTADLNIERILWIDPSYTVAVTIRLQDPKALPIRQKCQELEEAISAQQARILEVDPYGSLLKTENTITEKHKSYRDKAWEIIEPLIGAHPAVGGVGKKRGCRENSHCTQHK